MINLTRSMVAPIVAVVVLLLKSFGVEIGQDLESQIVESVVLGGAVVTAIWGIIKNHKKEG